MKLLRRRGKKSTGFIRVGWTGIGGLVLCWLSGLTGVHAQSVIPLINHTATGQLGISVKLGTNPRPFEYILDTGSAGFFSARGSTSVWDGVVSGGNTGETFSISYGTGSLTYSGDVVNTTVTLTDVDGMSLTVPTARMGIITNEPYPGWNTKINTLPEPVPPEPDSPTDHFFYGTFGAGLFRTDAANGSVGSILGQVPLASGLIKGFMISTGGSNSTTPTLTIGLTQAMIDSFPIIIPMSASTGNATNDNGTSVKLYPEAQTRADYEITHGGDHYSATAGLLMDTGGLGTHITTGTDIDPPGSLVDAGKIKTGASFSVLVDGVMPGSGLDWRINPTGTTPFVNEVAVETGSAAGSLNTGIALFYQYDVLFDTENGIIALRPVPEPHSALLLLVAAAAWPGIRRLMAKRK